MPADVTGTQPDNNSSVMTYLSLRDYSCARGLDDFDVEESSSKTDRRDISG